MDYIQFHQDDIDKHQVKIDEIDAELKSATGRKERKLQKEREKLVGKREKSEYLRDRILNGEIEESKWTKIGDQLESKGQKLQDTGGKMTRVGAHATGAVWTPVLYVGYQGAKHALKKPKNETPEKDLIELIQEVEQAHKDGKITEEQKQDYVVDFVDNYYRK